MNILKKSLANPFKTYFKLGSIGFGLTFISNVGTGMAQYNKNINFYENPQSFIFLSFLKSTFFGFLWPSIPIVLIKNPKDYLLLGHGMERYGKTLEDEINKN